MATAQATELVLPALLAEAVPWMERLVPPVGTRLAGPGGDATEGVAPLLPCTRGRVSGV